MGNLWSSTTKLFLSTVFFASVISPYALAQEAANAGDAASDEQVETEGLSEGGDTIVLEPVTVTALKRKENPQKMASSVTVIEGDGMTSNAMDSGAAITRAAPNFYFGSVSIPGQDFTLMRGIGPLGQPSNSLDNSVGYATNGVGTSSFGFPPNLLDVDRVEILRGPQGTLFGRNAMGGMVNVVTREADGEKELKIAGELGTEGHHIAEVAGGGWLSEDVLAGRVAARLQSLDGDITNNITGKDEGNVDMGAIRGSLRFTPTDDLMVDFVAGYDKDERNGNFLLYAEHPDFPISGQDREPINERERWEATATVEKAFDPFIFTSVTNVQKFDLFADNDLADELLFPAVGFGNPPRGADRNLQNQDELVFNQEFRLNSPENAKVSWVAGINYFRSDYDSFRDQNSSYSPYSSGKFDTEIDSQTIAAFGDISVPVWEKLTVSGGLRLAHDKQEFSTSYLTNGFAGTAASYSQDSEIDDTYLTGRAALSYEWTDQVMTYASVARGYTSGGYERLALNSAVGADVVPFDPSKSWAYEVGAKTTWLDDRIDLNISAFYNDVTDGQLVHFIVGPPNIFSFLNQDYETYGFEVETRASITDKLTIGGGIGVTQTKIKDPVQADIKEDNAVPNVPKFTANVNIAYNFYEGFYAAGQYQFVGDREMDVQNNAELDAYHMVNGRIGWSEEDINLYVFSNNLLDERPEYFGSRYNANAHTLTVGPGRVVGVGFSKTF